MLSPLMKPECVLCAEFDDVLCCVLKSLFPGDELFKVLKGMTQMELSDLSYRALVLYVLSHAKVREGKQRKERKEKRP